MNSTPVPRLRWIAIVALGLLLLGIVVLVIAGPSLLGQLLPALPDSPVATPPEEPVILPEEYLKPFPRYGQREAAIPVKDQVVTATPAPSVPDTATVAAAIKDYVMPSPPPSSQPPQPPSTPPGVSQSRTPVAQPKPKKEWKALIEGQSAQETAAADAITAQAKAQLKSPAEDLIRPAKWAIPAYPLHTLYRSQVLPCRTLQAINSDLPGQTLLELTTPVFDKFGYDVTILEKHTKVVVTQQGQPQYGQTRIPLKLDQFELPTGEIIAVNASVGDADGANGLAGKVNNHYGKLILGAGLSALLNIGAGYATGTPGRGQFYQDPLQAAGQDIGRDVQRTAQGVIDRELKRPPTITAKAGAECTIALLENISFNRPPHVAR